MADIEPGLRQQIVDAVNEALARARPMPTPSHVTEVVFRMGAPDALQALRTGDPDAGGGLPPYFACPTCLSCFCLSLDDLLEELDFPGPDEATLQRLVSRLGSSRRDTLARLLRRVLAGEAKEWLDELGEGTARERRGGRRGSSGG
jgi:hypothetical protein